MHLFLLGWHDVVFSFLQIPARVGLLVILLVDWIFPKLIVVLIVKFFVFFLKQHFEAATYYENFVKFSYGPMGESFQMMSIGSFSEVVTVIASNFLFFLYLLTTYLWVGL